MKETLTSRRIAVINSQTYDMHDDVANLNEALVDREPEDALKIIDSLRNKINILKEQITDGDII